MTYLVDRLAQIHRQLLHLREVRPKVSSADSLRHDQTLQNDVLFSLMMICQHVIDVASELCSRKSVSFGDYTEAIRGLAVYPAFSPELLRQLAQLPGFRNIVIHEYIILDFDRVLAALDQLEPVAQFVEIVRQMEVE